MKIFHDLSDSPDSNINLIKLIVENHSSNIKLYKSITIEPEDYHAQLLDNNRKQLTLGREVYMIYLHNKKFIIATHETGRVQITRRE